MTNFDSAPDRINTYSEKWDLRKKVFGKEVLPLWVADTDFMIPDFLINALKKRISTSPLGYTFVPDDFFGPIDHWHKSINHSDIEKFPKTANATVMSSMNLLIRLLTKPADKILIFNPIYFPFFKTVEKTKRKPLFFDLVYDDTDIFKIDFKKLEDFIKSNQPKLILFCNPHNPGGKVWTDDDVKNLVNISRRYNIPIISDEIHSDLILKGQFNSLSKYFTSKDNFAVLDGPTKTFNIAGLKTSFVIFSNSELQDAFLKRRDDYSYPKLNTMAIESAIEVYTNGANYLHDLIDYLNKNLAYISENLDSRYKVQPTQATYLAFIKIPDGLTDEQFYKLTVKNNIGIQLGRDFGTNGNGYFRLNFGTQLKNIITAVDSLNKIIQ